MEYLCYNFAELTESKVDCSVLSADEQQFSYKRRLAKALLRHEIARRTGKSAQDIQFFTNEHGKPYTEGIHFNISHSDNLLCMAFHHMNIGIDIQKSRQAANIARLASRIMSPDQFEQFNDSGKRIQDFYYCWAITEALVKLHGTSIWNAKNYPFVFKNNRVNLSFENNITIQLIQPQPEYYGAIAYLHSPENETN